MEKDIETENEIGNNNSTLTKTDNNTESATKDELDYIEKNDSSNAPSKFSDLSKEEKQRLIQEFQEKLKNNPSSFNNMYNYRPSYLEEFKNNIKHSNYDFNFRLNCFLNYIKSKKADNSSILIKNELIDLNYSYTETKTEPNVNNKSEKEAETISFELFKSLSESKTNEESQISNETPNNSLPLIVDLLGYIDRSDYSVGPIDKERLTLQLSKLKNLGTLIIFADLSTIISFEEYFKEKFSKEPMTNYLIKSVVISKVPILSLISIQKFELKTNVDFSNFKIHFAEFIALPSSLPKINKIHDLSFTEYTRAHTYRYQLEQVSPLMKRVSRFS
jgi:hypothetical protein